MAFGLAKGNMRFDAGWQDFTVYRFSVGLISDRILLFYALRLNIVYISS